MSPCCHVQSAELDCLCRAAPGPAEERLVVPAREYALQRLLGLIATTEGRRFVDDRLGSLIAWDHEHRSHLLRRIAFGDVRLD